MNINKHITIISVALLFSLCAFGQKPKRICKTHENHLKMMSENPTYARKRAIHNTVITRSNSSNKKITTEILHTVPVVVHVIHQGEPEGSGGNIPLSQIKSAIIALNLDFRSTNADTLASSHPFYPLQADINIEFCLANKDPQGFVTTGVTRHDKGKSSWGMDDFDVNVKPETIWDISKYLNIWITTIGNPDEGTLGYATTPSWPESSEVGVVIGPMYFGTTGTLDPDFNKSRTVTHEIGHFFNLTHIWGDETCGDDFVPDTPPQVGFNDSNCPSFPHNVGSQCNPGANGEMFMNYMDYTLDACMQLFTTGQKDRMRSAIQLPDRIGLTTSNGCSNPSNVNFVSSVNIRIYPNPATSSTTISSTNNLALSSITLYNLKGQMLDVSISIEERKAKINTSSLPNGTYIISIATPPGTVNKNLVVIR
jgi:hypothetical protein